MMLNGEMTLNICIAANAKNSYGAYAGKQTTLAELFCANPHLRYEPFAEVEQLGRVSRSQ